MTPIMGVIFPSNCLIILEHWRVDMSETKILLGKRIRSLRRIKDLSQEELAEKANMSGKYVGEIERGQANITIDILEKISTALNVEISELFDHQHEIDRQELIPKINSLLEDADDQNLQTIFRIIKSILK